MLSDLYSGSLEDARARQERVSIAELEAAIALKPPALNVLAALAPDEVIKIIAEVKRASPSRGELAEIVDPQRLAKQYEAGGAAAVSVLTEQRRFKGSLADLESVRKTVSVPVLRKDFIASEYQLLEARAAGADMVLLIVAGLEQPLLKRLYELTLQLEMTVLVETHTSEEVSRAVDLGAELIGVNARNLNDFTLDRDLFAQVADQIPSGVIRVAESAVMSVADVAHYRSAGADAVLVGEALVVNGDPTETVAEFASVA
ncbi:indole-3-glycerol phosphate synthase TrpC [Canibacter sp. lx-72]|uniref:indole-3-glycerol phosphate synthase TrpC n=1 Tax=Canibacter zhuwentaonis TaxID=2837491 RepID=UPI001BDD471F|nr:indole-3-glycerol phosphate synthase TrpC [Canibacter zhuwentaonis]